MAWSRLRQVVVAVPELAQAAAEVRATFALAPGFTDEGLAPMGILDETIELGDRASYLVVAAPAGPDSGIARWLERTGAGGFAVSFQVTDLAPFVQRAAASGIEKIADVRVDGCRVIQWRPKDLGILVELDEVPDTQRWFWDDRELAPAPAPQVDTFDAIEISGPDPDTLVARWSALFDSAVSEGDGTPSIAFSNVTVRFVHGAPMISGLAMRRTEHSTLAAGWSETLVGVRFDVA